MCALAHSSRGCASLEGEKWPPRQEATIVLSFHTDDLTECMDDIDQITLGGHDLIDVFVRSGCFIQHVFIFATLDVLGRLSVVFEGK